MTLRFLRYTYMKHLITLLILTLALPVAAHEPVYIVNGERSTAEAVERIAPRDIESMDTLPADEESVAKYGIEASHGVIIITLRYDSPARFEAAGGMSFGDYISSCVKWDESEAAARVVVRYTIPSSGRAVLDTVLESTDSRLKRRVLKALESAPAWIPAMKNGVAIESEGVLRVQLPKGKPMPRQIELVIR